MASTSSNSSRRRSERTRDKAADCGGEGEPGERSSINHRALHHPSRPSRGNVSFGSSHDEQLKPPRSPVPNRPSSRLAQLKKKARDRVIVEEDDSSEGSEVCSGRSRASSITGSTHALSPRSITDSHDPVWRDEGYGSVTTASTRSNHSKRGKEKLDYNSSLSRVSSRDSLREKARSQKKSRKARPPSLDLEIDEDTRSENDTHLAKQGDEEEDSDSDDEFAKRTVEIMDSNKQRVEVLAILDTGTGPDWISHDYLTKLGFKSSKLNEDQNRQFSDFNGKSFKPYGKVQLMVSSHEFEGFPCRTLTFLVSRESTFKILLGKKTIKAEGLFSRKARESLGDGAHIGLQPKISKAEQAEIARKKIEQEKQAAEQEKKREERRKARSKEKQETRPRPANLAQESKPPPRRRSKSPQARSSKSSLKTKGVAQEKSSSESLEGTW